MIPLQDASFDALNAGSADGSIIAQIFNDVLNCDLWPFLSRCRVTLLQDASFDALNAGSADGNIIAQIFNDVFVGRYGHPGGAVAALCIPLAALYFAGQACQTAQSRSAASYV